MIYELATPIEVQTPHGTLTLTHEEFYQYTHLSDQQQIRTHRRFGSLDLEGRFVSASAWYPDESVIIEGAEYDALLAEDPATGKKAGKFWPSDVVGKHREIAALRG